MNNPALRRIVPLPRIGSEVFQPYEVAHEFYEEVRHRKQREEYCQWYRATAAQNQRDLQQVSSTHSTNS